MKYVLVTGSEGQLGRSIQKLAKDHPAIEFDFMDSKGLDITNSEAINTLFKSKDYDYCINCAAYTNVDQAEKTPERAFEVNAEGVKNVALACKEHNVVLIHISTDYVFDGEKETPYSVKDKPNPINEYGKSKLLGETKIQDTIKKYHIVRTSWLYSEYGKNFYNTILEKAKTETSLQITDEQTGCPTNASNLARFIIKDLILNTTDYGIHHFTDGIALTWYSFAKKILYENGLERMVLLEKVKNYCTFAKRPKNSVLEINKRNLYK